MLRGMLCSLKGRDQNGYPTERIDMVPERKLSTFVQLLQEANQRNDRLQNERDDWGRLYHDLYQEY